MNLLVDWFVASPEIQGSLQQGLFAAAVLALGVLLVRAVAPRWRWVAASALLAGITPLATLGFWYSTGDLGVSDWDYYFSLHHTHRQTLLTFGELPHWNPYICGGTAGLADPEFRFFTPTFLLQLAFGVPVGFVLAIWLATATGAIGILFLGKRLKHSPEASLLAALTFSFGTVTLLEIVEGHPNVFAAMYIPWIFWAWLGAYRSFAKQGGRDFAKKSVSEPSRHGLSRLLSLDNTTLTAARRDPSGGPPLAGRPVSFRAKSLATCSWCIATAIFLTLAFFQGGIYLLMYTGIAFLVLPLLVSRRGAALKVSLFSGLIALGLAAVKLVPVGLWLSQFQDVAYASSTWTLPYLHEILLGRYLHDAGEILPDQGSGWHEYGAYVGPFVLVLALIALVARWRNRVVRGLALATIAAVLLSSSGPVLKPLFDQAPFLPRSNISRVILFAVLPLSLLAGFGLDTIRKRTSGLVRTTIVAAILFLVAADLFTLAYPLSKQAFVLPRVTQPPPTVNQIEYAQFDFPTRHRGHDYTRAYEATIRGYGTFAYCSVLGPGTERSEPAVRTIHDEGGSQLIQIDAVEQADQATYQLVAWSPNRVVVDVTTPPDSSVTLNTNYALGWQVNDQPAKDIAGRVGVTIPEAGRRQLVFAYKTPGLGVGAAISLATVGLAAWLLVRGRRYLRDE